MIRSINWKVLLLTFISCRQSWYTLKDRWWLIALSWEHVSVDLWWETAHKWKWAQRMIAIIRIITKNCQNAEPSWVIGGRRAWWKYLDWRELVWLSFWLRCSLWNCLNKSKRMGTNWLVKLKSITPFLRLVAHYRFKGDVNQLISWDLMLIRSSVAS